jgi:hypothetical protein
VDTTEKLAKFLKYQANRLKKATAGIEQLGKLSSSSYSWSPVEVTKMANDLHDHIDVMLNAFKNRCAWKAGGGA